MLVGKFDVDYVISGFGWAVGHFAGSVFHIRTVNVNFAGPLNGQTETSITYKILTRTKGFYD